MSDISEILAILKDQSVNSPQNKLSDHRLIWQLAKILTKILLGRAEYVPC